MEETAGEADKREIEGREVLWGTSLSVLPYSDFQIENSDLSTLPTLKELIGYRINYYTSSPAPVFLNILSDNAQGSDVYAVEGKRNRGLESVVSTDNTLARDAKVISRSNRTEEGREREFRLPEDPYFAGNKIADDKEDVSLSNKKRVDRQDSMITIPTSPTTMRGIPLAELLRKQIPRGFYLTREEKEFRITDETENGTFDTIPATTYPFGSSILAEKSNQFRSKLNDWTRGQFLSNDHTARSVENNDSISNPAPNLKRNSTSASLRSIPLTKVERNSFDAIGTETEHSYPYNEGLAVAGGAKSNVYITRKVESRYESNRRRYARPLVGNRKAPRKEDEVAETDSWHRAIAYRGRHRFQSPVKAKVTEHSAKEGHVPKAKDIFKKRIRVNELAINQSNERISNGTGVSETMKLAPESNPTRNDAVSIEEQLWIADDIDGFKVEVNHSTGTEQSGQSGTISSTKSKKPVNHARTPQRTTATNAIVIANRRQTRPTDNNSTVDSKEFDTGDATTETSKLEKDIDQSSRAQEIAVTLAEPPSSQSTGTGRPPLRNALRRKVSGTIASTRTYATTIRTAPRFPLTFASRQRANATDKSVQRVAARTRRPPAVDYDYYEDEEEPVIGKTALREKLFLTSKGTIRCLDQGNFPHPHSCNKFITCAKMVNGLVIGAEYTCPDKLSFDPVGGICNWSAGLGCRE